MINILIADDHTIVRKGLKEVLARFTDMNVCCEAKNSAEVIQLIGEKDIDIVILDINMPGRNGFETLKDIKTLKSQIQVLILSVNSEELYARRCLRAGASGFMNKDIDIEEFILAIRKIAKGQKYISPLLASQLLLEAENNQSYKAPHDHLSDREFQIFIMLAQNKTPAEIAGVMNLSIKTINTYKSRIFNELNFLKIEDLFNYAVKHELISL